VLFRELLQPAFYCQTLRFGLRLECGGLIVGEFYSQVHRASFCLFLA
jgi:hypothetical protein